MPDKSTNTFSFCVGGAVPMFLLVCFAATWHSCGNPTDSPATDSSWSVADSIERSVRVPEFRSETYNVEAFGAKGDGVTDDRAAFQSAIDRCSADGGGRVVAGAEEYLLNGPLVLKSNVHLRFDDGTYVRFSNTPSDYLPVVKTRWEGVECYNYSPMIYAYDAENIAISGKATLDAQADEEHWWPWKGRSGTVDPTVDMGSRDSLIVQNREQVPLQDRQFGAGHSLRPNFVQPYLCRNVLISEITLVNSPMWVVHPVLCENVTVDGITVNSHGPNNDGCNPESCRNVVFKNCVFDTGDDCIALKSGRNQDGRRINRPIENVVIRDCMMKDGHGGVVIGSEVSGGARKIFARDCRMDSPNLERAIRVKTNKSRGGVIENLYFKNIAVGEVSESVVKINMQYTLDDSLSVNYPVIRDIHVENITSEKSRYGLQLIGLNEEHQVSGVMVRNCNFAGVASGNVLVHTGDLDISGLIINGDQWSPE